MSTAAQVAANRANAHSSTGPRTTEGKAKTCLNAVKTGLTGRTVVLPGEDAHEYQRHLSAYEKEFQPVGQRECDLVQSIADLVWRLGRIPRLEMAIYAQGHMEFEHALDNHDPSVRSTMIELQTFLAYERRLRNLQLQEARLSRRREKETAELHKLQGERRARQREALDRAARQYVKAKHHSQAFHPAEHGFEFSIPEIERYLEGVHPDRIALWTRVPSVPAHSAAAHTENPRSQAA